MQSVVRVFSLRTVAGAIHAKRAPYSRQLRSASMSRIAFCDKSTLSLRKRLPVFQMCRRSLSTASAQQSSAVEAQTEKKLTEQFNSALNDLLAQQNFNALFLIYEDMLELGVPPDTQTYNILLRSCFASNDLAGVKEYLGTMREEQVTFNAETCRLCIQYSNVTQQVLEVEQLLEELSAGAYSFRLRDVEGLTDADFDTLLTSFVSLRSRKLAEYVIQERLNHVTLGSASSNFLKLQELVDRIPSGSNAPKA